ncbi:MAG TPA: hypothetical protein VIL85_16295 [Thermomicrobiales bacterium]
MAGEKKYEREIAEILERMDREEPKTERVKRQARQTVQRRRESFGDTLTGLRGVGGGFGATAGWTWIGVTVGIGLLGLLLRGISPLLAGVCAVLMFVAFFSPLVRQVSGPPAPAPSTMWRGNVVDLRPRGFMANVRYRWRRFLGGGNRFR